MIIDTHTHIYLNKEKHENLIISELNNDDISKIISIGIDIPSSQKSITLARKHPGTIYATVGIHPTEIQQYSENIQQTIEKLEKLIIKNRSVVKGIGECGLDFHWGEENQQGNDTKKVQEIFFRKQIELAEKYNLPIIIHARDSKEDILRILKDLNAKKFILHCYSEDLDFAYKALYFSSECKISFSGIVTYKSAINVQKTAANIPLNRILIETDCPFLAPQAVRGTENIPNNTKYNLQKIYELRLANGKKESLEEIEKQVYHNSLEIFSIT